MLDGWMDEWFDGCPLREDLPEKNTIRDGGSTALYTAYTVDTVDTVDTDDTIYTAYTIKTVYTVFTIATALHC